MKKYPPRVFLYALLLFYRVYSDSTYVLPSMPAQGESTFIAVEIDLFGGADLLDRGLTVAGHKIAVTVSVSASCSDSICPALWEKELVLLPCGPLPAGICTTMTAIQTGNTVKTDTICFRVYENPGTLPRISGFRMSRHAFKNGVSKNYYYTCNDTLSVVAAFNDHCCAEFIADCTGKGDTIGITLLDTGKDMCDCGRNTFYATVSMVNVPTPNPVVRIVRRNLFDRVDAPPFVADTTRPALCINPLDSVSPGYRLFVDSSWFDYEISTPVITQAAFLRLQPNRSFAAPTPNHLYVDHIVYCNMREYAGEEQIDTVENFEIYSAADWKEILFRDGSSLENEVLSTDSSHVLKITYSNTINGSCSDYFWRRASVQVPSAAHVSGKINLHASLAPPKGPTAVTTRTGSTDRRMVDIQILSDGRAPFIGCHGRIPESFAGNSLTVSIVTLHGRTAGSFTVSRKHPRSNEFIIDDINGRAPLRLSPGGYLMRISVPGAASCETAGMITVPAGR